MSGRTTELLENINNQFLADGGRFVGTDCTVGDPPTLSHQSPALSTRVRLGLRQDLRLGAGAGGVRSGCEEGEQLVQLPPEQSPGSTGSSPHPRSFAAVILPLVRTLLSLVICTANKVF